MSFRYSQLCGTGSDAVDAVITPEADKDRQSRLVGSSCPVVTRRAKSEAESEAQRVLNFKNINQDNSLKIKDI